MAHRPRVVAVIVLVIVAAAALHGYLPGAQPPPPRERPTTSLGSLFAVIAMLVVSMAIIVIAIVTQSRRRPVGYGPGEPPRAMTGERRPLTWRLILVAVAVAIAWLLLIALLSRLNSPAGLEQQSPTANPPPPGTPQPPPEPPDDPDPSSTVFSMLAGATMLLMLLTFVAAVIAGRRQRRRAAPVAPPDEYRPAPVAPASGSLARAAEVGLAEAADLSREPREAIIACYAAMERQLENSPDIVPRESDTPTEVLARAVEHRALRANSATELVELFEEARFSPHVMTEAHRETAVRVLRLVLDELRSVA
ncbi:DUF4129 domain-containing protein [Mycobacterium sp. 1274761.0]|uniref:DUF4129 domain-containing protein n=1 Tax=Mycobacterium sp. 1274761.0 TaxID=1834077 RepID=UPI000800B906|nr:DUF4129 domain-containing protein [Mycobacterium sp. 1274761.0]OBK71783.1 hypothetical protein A5651_18180 [Mycobacterium sp. 1274761.0]